MTLGQDSAMTVSQDTAQVQARIQRRLADIKSLQLDTSILDALEDEVDESHSPLKTAVMKPALFWWSTVTALVLGFVCGAVFAT